VQAYRRGVTDGPQTRSGKSWLVWVGVVGAVLSVAGAAGDLIPGLGLTDVWSAGPMLTQIVGGVLLLLVAVGLVDQYVSRREQTQRDAMLQRRWAALGGGYEHDVLAARLNALLEDAEWDRVAARSLDEVKWRFRDRIAQWATPMIEFEILAIVLGRLSALDARISSIQDRLREIVDSKAPEPSHRAARIVWFDTLAEAIGLREDLWRVAASQEEDAVPESNRWNKFRQALRDDDRKALEKRSAGVDSLASAEELLVELFTGCVADVEYRSHPGSSRAPVT
jgi:hypothetical protein